MRWLAVSPLTFPLNPSCHLWCRYYNWAWTPGFLKKNNKTQKEFMATSENSLAVSYRAKHSLNIWSGNCTASYLLKLVENLCSHKNLHMNVYISFVHKCQNLEKPRCPLVGERINNLWSIRTMECYSAVKINELSHDKTCSNLKWLLSEWSQSKKATYYMIPITIWHSAKGKTMEQ